MKIIVYPHDFGIGGSQLNAIELAGKVRDKGHEVLVFGRRGPLVERVEDLGLEFVESPRPGRRPSRRVVSALRTTVRARGIDVVHGYEWPPALEAALAVSRLPGSVAMATVMSMAVAPFLPRTMQLLVGTEQIMEAERDAGRRNIGLIEPPVDLDFNSDTGDYGLRAFRERWGLTVDSTTIVTVTRLAHEMKLEGILNAIDAVGVLAGEHDVQFVIVGDGPALDEVARRADSANERAGRPLVILTGALTDPRVAYQAADITVNMGGSALRSLAFAKPLVVQGEQGFFALMTPENVEDFLWTGWYGVGDRAEDGVANLMAALQPVLVDQDQRRRLGAIGRDLVTARFSLDRAADLQVDHYVKATQAMTPARARLADGVGSAVRFGRYLSHRMSAKLMHHGTMDDFNSKPVAASGSIRR